MVRPILNVQHVLAQGNGIVRESIEETVQQLSQNEDIRIVHNAIENTIEIRSGQIVEQYGIEPDKGANFDSVVGNYGTVDLSSLYKK